MWQYEKSIRDITLLAESKVLATKKYFGHFWGNGNHCDAMTMMLVESEIDEEIMSVFRTPTLKSLFSNGVNKLDLIRISDGALYQVEIGKSWPIILSEGLYTHSQAPEDNLWESSDIKHVQDLVQQISFNKNKQLYVFIVRDSVRYLFWLYRSYEMLDIRCR